MDPKKACIGNPGAKLKLTVDDYDRKFGKHSEIKIYCPVCDDQLYTHAVLSLNMRSSFHHPDGSQCQVVLRKKSYFADIDAALLDETQAEQLRNDFLEPENIKRAFAFMLYVLRSRSQKAQGTISADAFKLCVKMADAFNIWSLRNLQLWTIPYLLLALADFEVKFKKYSWRFTLRKKRGTSSFWLSTDECKLLLVYADTGNKVETEADNPFLISHELYLEGTRDISWMHPNLIKSITSIS